MDIKDFVNLSFLKAAALDALMRVRMPVIVGRMAKDHFQDNFRLGGFVNGGLHRWVESRRLSSGASSAASRYPTLLSRRNNLFKSINYYPGLYSVRIANDLPYASVHNWGADIPVTDRMRRFAWAKFYEAAGRDNKKAKSKRKKKSAPDSKLINPEASFWKGMALTKKTVIKIPQRQFIGDSRELNDAIAARLETEIRKILYS